MIDQTKLSHFWNKNVPEEFKHWMDSDFTSKANKYTTDMKHHLIDQIDFSNIKIALDWGCGGGLGTLLLSEYAEVVALDIAETSIEKCQQYLSEHGEKPAKTYLLNSIEDLIIEETVDLIYSASVVQHFPSCCYWEKIVSYWRSLQPKWIAIQTRHGDKIKSNGKAYFDETKNFILALYLTTEEVISSFEDRYELKYHKLIDDKYSMYEYFVFKMKGD